MPEKRDFYEILGVNRNAGDDEIKKAYRAKAKTCHPDLHPGDKEAESRFKELSEAYEVLSDQNNRARYDQFGHAGFDQTAGAGSYGGGGFGGFGDFDLGSIFESFFGGGFGGATRRTGPQRGESIHFHLTLSFEEAAFGCEKKLEFNRVENCEHCKGNGTADGSQPDSCPTCGGSGQVRTTRRTPMGAMSTMSECTTCHGRGRVVSHPCANCGGTGLARNKATLSIKVPAGIDHGQTISLRGQGHGGKYGGPAGDVLVEISVRPHPIFVRDRTSVHCDMPVTMVQAALGAELEVPTLDGRAMYTIPEGTQHGTVFRLKGKGIPVLNGKSRGDQYIHVIVETPKNLNKKQKAVLREFGEMLGDMNHPQAKGFRDKTK